MKGRNRSKLLYSAAVAGALLAYAGRRSAKWPNFRGKTVLITGGSRGLGLILARHLAREGARLALCARDRQELDRAEAELSSMGADVYTVVCDLRNPAEIDVMVSQVRQRFEQIDVLINNAGIIAVGPMDTMTLEDYREAMDVHFWAPLNTILAVAPEMRRRRQGRIVNIASIGGKISVPHLLPYCASKFALVGLSKGLHAELKKDGVLVTTVCPGLMRTGSPENAMFKGKHKSEYTWFSISDSLPGISMDADRAARQILSASRRGDAEIILSVPAKLAVKLDALFPELSARVLALTSQILPSSGGIGSDRALGSESHSRVSPSWLTTLGESAARRNNELEVRAELEPRSA